MNHADIAKLQATRDSIQAIVRDELARHPNDELADLIRRHIYQPNTVLAWAVASQKIDKIMAMAAVPLIDEFIRRAEVVAMEEA